MEPISQDLNNDEIENDKSAYIIPIDLIEPYQNARTEFPQERIQRLIDSINLIGLQNPIVVRKGSKGKWKLVSGELRCRAYKEMGRDSIPVRVTSLRGEKDVMTAGLLENLDRTDLKPVDKINGICSLKQFYKKQKDIASVIGKDTGYISHCFKVKNRIIEDNNFDIPSKWSINLLFKLAESRNPKEVYKRLCELGKDEPTLNDIRQIEKVPNIDTKKESYRNYLNYPLFLS